MQRVLPGDTDERMAQVIVQPPDRPSGPFICRLDEQARKGFYFYHDGQAVTRILCVRLDLAEMPYTRRRGNPVGPLILAED